MLIYCAYPQADDALTEHLKVHQKYRKAYNKDITQINIAVFYF